MTNMLASVMTVAEAKVALDLDADIIDLKNPREGALGALPLSTIREIVAVLGGRVTVSATIGDVPYEPAQIAHKVLATAETGVDIVKIGIDPNRSDKKLSREMTGLLKAHSTNISVCLIAVLFSDDILPLDWVDKLAESGFQGVMLDTADKRGGSLRTRHRDTDLKYFVEYAHSLNLLCGIAGSLQIEDIVPLLVMSPDYLGFRGALCRGTDRTAQLDIDAFRSVRSCIPRSRGSHTFTQSIGSVGSGEIFLSKNLT